MNNYFDDDELEKRLNTARQRGATEGQITQRRLKYVSSRSREKPQSFAGKVGKFAFNTVKGAVETATAMPRTALTAGKLYAAAPARAIAERRINKLSGQPLTAKSVKQMERAADVLKSASSTPLLTKRETAAYSKGKTPLERIGRGAVQGSKAGIGTATAVAGFGMGGMPSLAQSTLMGAGGGYASSGDTAAETVGGTVIGGAAGFALGLAGKVLSRYSSKIASKGKTKIRGGRLKESGINVVNKVENLQAVADDVGLTNRMTQEQQIKTLKSAFDSADDQIDDILSGAGSVSEDNFLDNLSERLLDTDFNDAAPGQRLFLNKELSKIEATGFDPMSLKTLKSKLRGELSNAFRAESAGNVPKATDQVKMAVWATIKDSLDEVSPQIRKLNSFQNALYNLGDEFGYAFQRNVPLNVGAPIGISNIRANLPLSKGNIGAYANRALNTVSGGPLAGKIAPIASDPRVAGAVGYLAGNVGGQTPQNAGTPGIPMTQGTTPQASGGQLQIKTAYDVATGNATKNDWVVSPDGKQIWNPSSQRFMPYNAKAFGGPEGGGLTGDFGDKLRMSQKSVGSLINDLKSGGLNVRPGQLSSRAQGLRSLAGAADPAFLEYKQRLEIATIALRNAMLGANMTDREMKKFELPSPNEPLATAGPKLEAVYTELNRWLGGSQ